VYVLDRSRGPIIGCGRKQPGLFARGTQPDINNRVCVDGRVRVPTEQLGTGGLGPYVPDVVMLPVTSEVMFMSPVARSQVSGRVTVVARPMGTDVRPYRIEWGAGASPTVWTPLITARQPGGTFLLATWDTSALPPGAYSLRVVRADGSLPTAAAAFETVNVGAPVMLPLTGLPISGTR
jgi:hypothetical protein